MRSEIGAGLGADAPDPGIMETGIVGALAALPGPVFYLDANGAFTGINGDGERVAAALAHPEAQPAAEKLREQAACVLATGHGLSHSFSLRDDDANRAIEASILKMQGTIALFLCRDATLDVNMRSALVDSRQRYKDLVEISSDFAWETNADGAFTFVSPRGALGYPANDLIGMPARNLLLDPDNIGGPIAFETDRPIDRSEMWLQSASREAVCVLSSAMPLFDKAGCRKGARGVCRDITNERLRENDLARHKAREQVVAFVVDAIRNEANPVNMLTTAVTSLGQAMTATSCAVYQTGESGKLSRAARFGTLPDGRRLAAVLKKHGSNLETSATRLPGHDLLIAATHYRGVANGAVVLSRKGASAPWSQEDRLLLNAVAGQLGIALQQVAEQQELLRLSRTDPLTGLLNRRAFMEELDRAMERSRRNRATSAVLYIDLNNFKVVNDLLGHAEGDRVLKELAAILRRSARSYDFVARLGGDEFALWLENVDQKLARRRAKTILENSRELLETGPVPEKPLGLSVGIALLHPKDQETSEALVKRADSAMYRAKQNKKQNIALAERQS